MHILLQASFRSYPFFGTSQTKIKERKHWERERELFGRHCWWAILIYSLLLQFYVHVDGFLQWTWLLKTLIGFMIKDQTFFWFLLYLCDYLVNMVMIAFMMNRLGDSDTTHQFCKFFNGPFFFNTLICMVCNSGTQVFWLKGYCWKYCCKVPELWKERWRNGSKNKQLQDRWLRNHWKVWWVR